MNSVHSQNGTLFTTKSFNLIHQTIKQKTTVESVPVTHTCHHSNICNIINFTRQFHMEINFVIIEFRLLISSYSNTFAAHYAKWSVLNILQWFKLFWCFNDFNFFAHSKSNSFFLAFRFKCQRLITFIWIHKTFKLFL